MSEGKYHEEEKHSIFQIINKALFVIVDVIEEDKSILLFSIHGHQDGNIVLNELLG